MCSLKFGKYTGQMGAEDRKKADQKLLNGELSVQVATESFKLRAENLNINQTMCIGCPCNLDVLLQEVGRAEDRKILLQMVYYCLMNVLMTNA